MRPLIQYFHEQEAKTCAEETVEKEGQEGLIVLSVICYSLPRKGAP